MKSINLNKLVSVKLNKVGIESIREYYADVENVLGGNPADEYENGDLFETQLWNLMQIFGPKIRLGDIVPIVGCEIFIKEEDLEDAEDFVIDN